MVKHEKEDAIIKPIVEKEDVIVKPIIEPERERVIRNSKNETDVIIKPILKKPKKEKKVIDPINQKRYYITRDQDGNSFKTEVDIHDVEGVDLIFIHNHQNRVYDPIRLLDEYNPIWLK